MDKKKIITAENDGERKKRRLSAPAKVLICAAAIIIAACAGIFSLHWISYSRAIDLMESGLCTEAEEALKLPGLTGLHDAGFIDYLDAREMLDQGSFSEAKAAFLALGNYRDSAHMALESDFLLAEKMLFEGDPSGAAEIFAELHSLGHPGADEGLKLARLAIGKALLYDEGNFSEACAIFSQLAESGFSEAGPMLWEAKHLWAMDYAEKGELIKAIEKLSDYPDHEAMDELRQLVFQKGQELYRSGKYAEALDHFTHIPDYPGARDYIILLYVRGQRSTRSMGSLGILDTIGYKDVILPEQQYEELMAIFEVEDAAQLLLAEHSLAFAFLLGTWESSDGFCGMEISEETGCTFWNLPYYQDSGFNDQYFYIENGEYRVFGDDFRDYRVAFTITVESPDHIKLFCHKDGSIKSLFRQ